MLNMTTMTTAHSFTKYLGDHRIEFTDGGVWVYPRDGQRGRFYSNDTETAKSLRAGNLPSFKQARNYKPGTIEPVYYLENADGEIGVPPEPGLPVPEGSVLREARSLQEIDHITRLMNEELADKFRDQGEFTSMMDSVMGGPREKLVENLMHPKSNFERDLIPMLIDVLDEQAYERKRSGKTELFFRHRES